ncbi:MAG: cytochrome c peroxidase [Chloroflexota bacterium]
MFTNKMRLAYAMGFIAIIVLAFAACRGNRDEAVEGTPNPLEEPAEDAIAVGSNPTTTAQEEPKRGRSQEAISDKNRSGHQTAVDKELYLAIASTQNVSASQEEQLTVPLEGDPEAGKTIYLGEGGCFFCHTFDGVPGANGKIGADHTNLRSRAAELARYTGVDSPEAFVRQSILDPNAYISKACPNGPCPTSIMPQDFGEMLSDDQIKDLVAFLLYWQPDTVGTTAENRSPDELFILDDGDIDLPAIEPLDLEGEVMVAGSSTLFPLTERMVRRFYEDGFIGNINHEGIGTLEGFEHFCDLAHTDIATASRPMNGIELAACQEMEREPVEFSVGMDALAVVVNPSSTFVQQVSQEELTMLLTAELWSDVDPSWPNAPIEHYLPAPDTATFSFFVDSLFDGDPDSLLNAPNATFFADQASLAEGVAFDIFGIGIVSYAFYQNNLEQLSLLSIDGTTPTVETVSTDGYPLTRPLFLYADSETLRTKPQVSGFLNFYLSHVSEEVTQVGYFPAGGKVIDEARIGFLATMGYDSYLETLGLAEFIRTEMVEPNIIVADGMPEPDGMAIMNYILTQSPYQEWGTWPQDDWNDFSGYLESGTPHGNVVRLYVNNIALDAAAQSDFDGILPLGSIIIKENYSNKEIADPGPLDHLTLMYKVEGFNPSANDWFWLLGNEDSSQENGVTISSEGRGAGCVACHGRLNNHDYLLRYGFGERPAVPSMAALLAGESTENESPVSEGGSSQSTAADSTTNDVAGDLETGDTESTNSPVITQRMLTSFEPLPSEATPHAYELTEELITLGRILYYEPRMSLRQDTSCNSCHPLDRYGVDGLPRSFTPKGTFGKRNAPSVYNGALHVAQLWDGRAETVEDQALGPITNPEEMGMPDPGYAEEILGSIPGYAPLFAAAFPDDEDPVNFRNVGIAIGAFERRLITRDRFDDFLNGDETALTEVEKRGLSTFVNTGCDFCHYGANLGGETFSKLGEMEPYPTEDLGVAGVTGIESDRYVFKVQSLRNIAKTGPYLHDGSIATLEETTRIMARYQLGKTLDEDEISDLVAFMNSLTGEIPEDYIFVPELPESGPDTPGPQ